jgi:hypothetical protein
MSRTKWLAGAMTLLAMVATACDQTPTATNTLAPTGDELANIAVSDEAMAGSVVFEQMGLADVQTADITAADVTTRTRSFDRTRDCPVSGTIEVQGVVTRTDHGDGTVEYNVDGSRTRSACTHQVGIFQIAVDGNSTYQAYRKRVNGQFAGPQTTSDQGSFTLTKTNTQTNESKTRQCTFSLTVVRNPDAGKMTVTGTMCGHQIDRTVGWDKQS